MVNIVISAAGFKYSDLMSNQICLFSILCVFLMSAIVWLSAVWQKAFKNACDESRSFTSHIKRSP